MFKQHEQAINDLEASKDQELALAKQRNEELSASVDALKVDIGNAKAGESQVSGSAFLASLMSAQELVRLREAAAEIASAKSNAEEELKAALSAQEDQVRSTVTHRLTSCVGDRASRTSHEFVR